LVILHTANAIRLFKDTSGGKSKRNISALRPDESTC
jgi:hypothetical protein